ncbi:MAG: PIN domain-containing protein [Cyanobacteria bacterium P01_F01_bin.53]
MRVLIDTNIILDFLLEREPFFQDAERLFQAIALESVTGYMTATTLTDIFYIARKHTKSIEQARLAVSSTLAALEICPVNRSVLESALSSGLTDFEDAVQIACAVDQGLDAILTRDAKGFVQSTVPTLSIVALLKKVNGSTGA